MNYINTSAQSNQQEIHLLTQLFIQSSSPTTTRYHIYGAHFVSRNHSKMYWYDYFRSYSILNTSYFVYINLGFSVVWMPAGCFSASSRCCATTLLLLLLLLLSIIIISLYTYTSLVPTIFPLLRKTTLPTTVATFGKLRPTAVTMEYYLQQPKTFGFRIETHIKKIYMITWSLSMFTMHQLRDHLALVLLPRMPSSYIRIYFHTYIIWVQNNNNNNHREIIILLFTLYVCDCTTNTIPIVPSFSVHEYNDLFIIISSPVHSSHKYDFIDFILWFYSHDMTLFFVVFSSSTIFLRIKKWRLFSMSKIRTDLSRKTISQIIFRKLFIFVDMKNHCWLCMKRKCAHSSAPKYFYVRIIITNFVHCAREPEMPFNYRWNVCSDLIDIAQTWITFIYIYSFIDV